MLRRTALISSISLITGASGCVRDWNNDSRIKITATATDCSNGEIDVDFDARKNSQEVEEKLDDVVSTDEYVETPNYDSATTELYDILQKHFDDGSGMIKFEGTCYNASISRVYDD